MDSTAHGGTSGAEEGPLAVESASAGESPGVGQDNGPEVAAELSRTLTAFGTASVLGGSLLATLSDRPTLRAFGRQSAMWGAINLTIAAVGAWRAHSHPARAASLHRTLLVNAGLDVGYIAVGGHIAHHRVTFGGRLTPAQARGHGLAVVVQGAGLMALDLIHAVRLKA